eukprot:COSAG01_NODE_23815_length_801_cov_0.700855_1_plen_150_part_00
MVIANSVIATPASRSCACIGSPCLRNCVHGASIGAAGSGGATPGAASVVGLWQQHEPEDLVALVGHEFSTLYAGWMEDEEEPRLAERAGDGGGDELNGQKGAERRGENDDDGDGGDDDDVGAILRERLRFLERLLQVHRHPRSTVVVSS